MRSRKDPGFGQSELFRSRLENLIDDRHELALLANQIDWPKLEKTFGVTFTDDRGRPAKPARLMIGLQYLKNLYNESDENVARRFIENPYWQYFCGNEYFEHELPCHPTSLVRWRKRIGQAGAEKMLLETIDAAKRANAISDNEMSEVNIDTTVQEKAIKYPTDGALVDTARRMLVRVASKEGVQLKQSYKFLGRKALMMHIRLKHKKDRKGAKKQLRKLRTFLGRVIRDIERKVKEPTAELISALLWDFQKRSSGKGRQASIRFTACTLPRCSA